MYIFISLIIIAENVSIGKDLLVEKLNVHVICGICVYYIGQ